MIPTRIGQQCNGGTFAGLNRIGNRLYAVIVSPKSAEQHACSRKLSFSIYATTATSLVDGFANTAVMSKIGSGYVAATYCTELTVNNYSDWYVPSMYELGLCWRYLSNKNTAGRFGNYDFTSEENKLIRKVEPHAVPVKHSNEDEIPFGKLLLKINCNKDTRFSKFMYDTSTCLPNRLNYRIIQMFSNGVQLPHISSAVVTVRPVRRELLAKVPRK